MRAAAVYQPSTPQIPYRINKTITWGDASTEVVRLDHNGLFQLNGVRKRLLGFDIGYNGFVNGDNGKVWETGNPAILEAELAWMQAQGIRIVTMVFGQVSGALAWASDILDLFYEYKMLVVPQIVLKWETNFDPPSDNFVVSGEVTRDAFITAAATLFAGYQNVVAISLENEIDYLLGGHTYTPTNAAEYLSEGRALIKAQMTVPVNTELMTSFSSSNYSAIQRACLPYSDIPEYTAYRETIAEFNAQFLVAKARNAEASKGTGFWIMEFGTPSGADPSAPAMTAAMITNTFAEGATVVFLFVANRNFAGQDSDWSWFDAAGDPIANLTTNIVPSIATWQASI